jgi:hypothetical protein
MAFQLSPGVVVTEQDRTTVVPTVATTSGGFAGAFQWGPVEEVTTVDSETNLVSAFGKPNDTTAGYFFTAANFLSYGNNLKVVRVVDKGVARNAVTRPTGTITGVNIPANNTNDSIYFTSSANLTALFDTDAFVITRATGTPVLNTSNGKVVSLTVSSTGFGYNTAPTVTLVGGSPTSTATATATLSSGQVSNIFVLDGGNNYTTSSNVVIQNQDSTSARANLVLRFKMRDANISVIGSGYTSNANIVFSGNIDATGIHATANLVITNGNITGVTIVTQGNGYIGAPNVTINRNSANTGTNATVVANVAYGYIDSITIDNPGIAGYYFVPNVTINRNNALGGTNAAVQARISAYVSTLTLTANGYGYISTPSVQITPATADLNYITANVAANAVVKYPLQSVTIVNAGSGYTSSANLVSILSSNVSVLETTANIALAPPVITNGDNFIASYSTGGLAFGEFSARYPGELGNSIKVSMADSATYSAWLYKSQFDGAPSTSAYASGKGGSNDEIHILVIDADGSWSGTAGTVLEKYAYVSKASDAKNSDGSTNYYKNIINNQSEYIWSLDHPTSVTSWGNEAKSTTFGSLAANVTTTLSGGVSGDSVSTGNVSTGYALFSNDELYDVGLIPMGPTTAVSAVNAAIAIAETRRDAVVFASPPYADVVNTTSQADNIVTYRNQLTSSSYAVLDSGWKYQYDRYNDKYRYVPLNGDIAGLAVRTDLVSDPWFSPAGYNRGVVKNLVKLAYSPSKTDRDTLYKSGVNPVVTFPGQGTLLFGDKTLLARPSAFDRINVRRLFIVLEKSIATAAKFQLFEFNDPFTRNQFKNIVEPFLRDVQGRRGITDFKVVCDETNNTPAVIDRNEFTADIYIKPSRAINFIQLNFIATRSGISFQEVGA